MLISVDKLLLTNLSPEQTRRARKQIISENVFKGTGEKPKQTGIKGSESNKWDAQM